MQFCYRRDMISLNITQTLLNPFTCLLCKYNQDSMWEMGIAISNTHHQTGKPVLTLSQSDLCLVVNLKMIQFSLFYVLTERNWW